MVVAKTFKKTLDSRKLNKWIPDKTEPKLSFKAQMASCSGNIMRRPWCLEKLKVKEEEVDQQTGVAGIFHNYLPSIPCSPSQCTWIHLPSIPCCHSWHTWTLLPSIPSSQSWCTHSLLPSIPCLVSLPRLQTQRKGPPQFHTVRSRTGDVIQPLLTIGGNEPGSVTVAQRPTAPQVSSPWGRQIFPVSPVRAGPLISSRR